MAGRKKIPTEIKKVRGTLRKGRELDNPMQVSPVENLPAAPKWLSVIGKEQFDIVVLQLRDLGMLYSIDLKLIEAYANAISLHIECEQTLREVGRVQVYRDEEGRPKHSQIVPLQSVSKQALDQALKLAVNFGITPSARTKISAPAKLEIKDNEFNFFD
jgi:P27 family predicted phage terminase small subunit